MSDTPLTDAVNARDHNAVTGYYEMTEHARQLERQLADAVRLPQERPRNSDLYSTGWNDCIRWIRQSRHDAAMPSAHRQESEK